MHEYTNSSLYSVLIKNSKSCVSLGTSHENRVCGKNLIKYNAHTSYTYLYSSPDFNLKKSNSVTTAVHSFTSSDSGTINDALIKNYNQNRRFKITDKMTQEKLHKNHETETQDLANKGREPVTIINQLSSDIDINSIVDGLLSDEELSKISSLYVVVPSSDDDETPITMSRQNFTTCVQLSEHNNTLNNLANLYWSFKKPSKKAEHLAVSHKGKQYFLEGLPITASYFNNVDITKDWNNCLTSKPKELKKNKLCQITTPNEKVCIDVRQLKTQNNVVATDTTVDRPCCCMVTPKLPEKEYKDSSATTSVVSQMLISSNFLRQGIDSNSVEHSKQIRKKQFLHSSGSQSAVSFSTCQINQCSIRGRCCTPRDFFLQSLPSSNQADKSATEHSCKCNPDKIKQIFDKLHVNKMNNMKNTACGERLDEPYPATILAANSKAAPRIETYFKSYQKDCMKSNKKKTVTIRPISSSENYQIQVPRPEFRPQYETYSIGCQSACKDNFVVIGPGGKEIPVLGQTVPSCPGMTDGPVNIAIQNDLECGKCSGVLPYLKKRSKYFKCKKKSKAKKLSDTSRLKSEIGLVEVMGPLGGYAIIGFGGTYTQAGLKELRISTAVGPDVAADRVDIVNMSVFNLKSKSNNKVDTIDTAKKSVSKEKSKTNDQIDMATVDKKVTSRTNSLDKANDPVDTANMAVTSEKSKTSYKVETIMSETDKKDRSNNFIESLNVAVANKDKNHYCECSKYSKIGPSHLTADYSDTAWIDPKLLGQLRSELTQTTSGFLINKKPKPNVTEVEIEVSLEDAIRYYASQHPEVLIDLFTPVTKDGTHAQPCCCESDMHCQCPLDSTPIPIPQPTSEPRPSIIKLKDDTMDVETTPCTGFTLKVPGKGSASQGLSHIIVFR